MAGLVIDDATSTSMKIENQIRQLGIWYLTVLGEF
jgi:hypothetical protein